MMEQNYYLNIQKISIRNEIHNEITRKKNMEALTRKTDGGRQVVLWIYCLLCIRYLFLSFSILLFLFTYFISIESKLLLSVFPFFLSISIYQFYFHRIQITPLSFYLFLSIEGYLLLSENLGTLLNHVTTLVQS